MAAEFDLSQRFVLVGCVASAIRAKPVLWNGWSRGVDTLLGGWQFSSHLCSANRTSAYYQSVRGHQPGGESAVAARTGLRTESCRTTSAASTVGSIQRIAVLRAVPGPGFRGQQIYGKLGSRRGAGPGYGEPGFQPRQGHSLGERVTAQFRAEFFNAFNHTKLRRSGRNHRSGFGQIVSASDARIIQFALKLRF